MSESRTKIAGVWVPILLVFLAAGCGFGGPPGPDEVVTGEPVRAHTEEVIVTSDDPALPEGCHPRPVAELLIRFFDAFNQGRQEELSRSFFISEGPSPPDFSSTGYRPWSWYSSTQTGEGGKVTRHFTTSDQGELLRYFARRHQRGETMRLLKVSLTQVGLLDRESNVGFVYVVTRKAPDLGPDLGGPARIAYGKGSLNCENLRIFTWSMNMKTQEDRTEREAAAWLCKDPPGWRPGEAVVACT
jgi:hypothetical protein